MDSSLRQAAQQALEAMEYSGMDVGKFNRINAACQALRVALAEPQIDPVDEYRKGFIAGQIDMRDRDQAQPVQEPVAWRFRMSEVLPWSLSDDGYYVSCKKDIRYIVEPLYTASPYRKPISDEER